MSILVRYQPSGLTREQHDEVTRRLESNGAWPPDGLQLHVLFGSDGDLRISEVWESEARLRAFQPQLLPVLTEVGVKLHSEPELFEVHVLEQPRTSA